MGRQCKHTVTPLYTTYLFRSRKWAEFYNNKCREMGVASVNLHAINDEWVEAWKAFFYPDHTRRVREEKNILMNKHKILRR